MKEQAWLCRNCHRTGCVEYGDGDGAYLVLDRIRTSHFAVIPECHRPDLVAVPRDGKFNGKSEPKPLQ